MSALPAEHDGCRQVLVDGMAKHGVEATVSTAPPIIPTPYDQAPFRCPHGVNFYMAPTSEQIAEWRRDGVA